eukprot:scaffold305552_cov26-Tisochrysis_lutea.AAC.2
MARPSSRSLPTQAPGGGGGDGSGGDSGGAEPPPGPVCSPGFNHGHEMTSPKPRRTNVRNRTNGLSHKDTLAGGAGGGGDGGGGEGAGADGGGGE